MDDIQEEFMERWIRNKAVAPIGPGPRLLSEQQRRSWWEFCLGMFEFLQSLLRDRVVSDDQARQLSRLQWIVLKGTYLFATPAPELRAEQERYVQLCINVTAAFAVIVDEPTELKEMCGSAYSIDPSKTAALAEALVVNQLYGWNDWQDARSPIAWVKDRTGTIHEQDHVLGGTVRESDALYSTPKGSVAKSDDSVAFDQRSRNRGVLPLEEVSEFPGEASRGLSPHWIAVRLNDLILAVEGDDNLLAYVKLRVRGYKPRAAWERLGWSETHGQAVDRRFRRARMMLKASGFDYQPREIELPPGLSDASCSVVKERLRIPVARAAESTLSGRVVYEPRLPGQEI
jgi:hypothetical protein